MRTPKADVAQQNRKEGCFSIQVASAGVPEPYAYLKMGSSTSSVPSRGTGLFVRLWQSMPASLGTLQPSLLGCSSPSLFPCLPSLLEALEPYPLQTLQLYHLQASIQKGKKPRWKVAS